METYEGTDLVKRICYGCGEPVDSIEDLWVDVDANCCVCTDCRNNATDMYPNEEQWKQSIVPASSMLPEDVNDVVEG